MRFFQRHPVVPVLRFSGAIGMVSPLRSGISLGTTAAGIERAFRASKTPAVAMLINSPGGSPVQSHLIYQRIRAHADEQGKKVYAFTEDVCASGGYFLALAGDEIYADPSSIVGSIGVVSAGFGFDKAIERLGIDRRIYTSGERKVALDPFSPEKADEIERLKDLQRDVHDTFIGLVKTRRAGRLAAGDDVLFSGEFWSGPKAVKLGLVDGLGELRAKMRALFGDKVKLPIIPFGGGWLRRRFGLGGRWETTGLLTGAGGATLAGDLLATLEERALWARYGL
jgi:signal peptide peptidase SppA